MALTLADKSLVISGEFDGRDAEDVHWDLVALGAYVKKSVTRTTAALIAGDGPAPRYLRGAEKHGTPIVDQRGLEALLGGATLDAVLAGEAVDSGATDDLEGWTVAIGGQLDGRPHASLRTTLEGRGARVIGTPSARCDLLLLGVDPSAAAIQARDEGVLFLQGDELARFLGGEPVGTFLPRPVAGIVDRPGFVEALLDELFDELTDAGADEPWDDELTLVVQPSGRPVLELRDLGGTPIHDRARRVLQRHSWPSGNDTVILTRPVRWT